MTEPRTERSPRALRLAIVVALVAAIAAAGVSALLVNIFTRQSEARSPFYRVVELDDDDVDPAIWGKNFPHQYDAYLRTVDQQRTRFGGSEAVPRTPTSDDPRTAVAQSRLEEDPRLVRMWNGYAFAVDFREERGHAHMLDDQTFTGRQHVTEQPGTCIHCHASTYVAYRTLGDGDLTRGFEALNAMSYPEAREHVGHPVACIDCHDPATMALRVTRPAFMEGIRAYRASQGDPDFDVNRDATRQEMRTYVCGQCHVEYYFRGPEKRLTYPWSRGLRGDEILAYYDEESGDHRDFVHADTGAPTLKAQHPEFEMFSQGIHARAGVACADCHMPYTRVGALHISDHHVRSPLLNIDNACQRCHAVDSTELRDRAETIQARTLAMRDRSLDVLVELIDATAAARAAGASDPDLAAARDAQRRAQFLLDFVEAENSSGFHAPQESARLLFLSIDHAHRGLRSLGAAPASPAPEGSGSPADAGPAPDAGIAPDAGRAAAQ